MKRLVATGALLGAVLAAAPAPAQDAASDAARLKQMLQCDAIQKESLRLSCYDQAARSSRSAMGGGRVGMLPGLNASPTRPPAQQFGMTPKLEKKRPDQVASPEPLKEITARVASARPHGAGMWQVAFADGSRWQMTETAHLFQPPARGDEVRIRKSSLGGFLMYIDHQPSVRVVRIQ